ncbi:isopeptide-forming domain-containing fimbrial protein [Bifidobacterium crudilactis]|uniref:isopeptide-forming domain-containing fimbrial protein n=1 Tax=Bifidobacterium crudilactis TaxID=327277 RepID=UPI00138E4EC1|nr:isopeptide-forming domain-containing fimbrial protein [Bifidobacterium crudilactis]
MKGGFCALVAFVLSMFMLLGGVLVGLPVERAAADDAAVTGTVKAGVADGYFSTLTAFPMRSVGATADGARKVLFGRSGSLANAAQEVESGDADTAEVDGKYLVLGKGPNTTSVNRSPRSTSESDSWAWSKTTQLDANEVLLWADDVVTTPFAFAAGSSCSGYPCNTFDAGTATDGVASYESYVAKVSRQLGSDTYYSDVELNQMGAASKLSGVCTKGGTTGCNSGYATDQSTSVGSYRVFPLSTGDMAEYFNANDGYIDADNVKRCPNIIHSASASWLRSAYWSNSNYAFYMEYGGRPNYIFTYDTGLGLRPALRLNVDNLLLSADSSNQSQGGGGDLRLTFVESGKKLHNGWSASVSGGEGSRVLSLSGSSDLDAQSGLGWKVVDPESNTVLGSGRTSSGGNMALPESAMSDESKDYDLYVWGQEDGSAAEGLTNKATEPVKTTIKGWKVKTPPSYGIELTGTTTGTLSAYKIGDYKDEVFDQTGALKRVMLTTPAALKDTLKEAAEIVGGSNVDADNPIGWVASHWLGYPTDPPTDDVTSAYSPYAGKLQLFAKELANKDAATLGGVKGSLNGLAGGPETLNVTGGPGLYLIVDSSQLSGGSLPIVVGTKVFNEALGDEGRFVDFADAGVKGKPRLGQASLKTTVTDIAKRIVNDAGVDGFDVGSQVEYEIALQVPDLSDAGYSSVAYDSYAFDVADVAESGLTLPAASGVRVLVDVPSSDTDVTGQLPSNSIMVSGQTLTVTGLKALFAESDGASGVRNKAVVPAGSLIRLRYKAVLNASAVVSSPVEGESLKPNVNTATLTRSRIGEVSNGWTDAGAGLESKAATANAYTFKLDLVKLDKDDLSKTLGGVEFEVSRDGQVLKFTQVSDGVYRLDAAGGTEVVTHTDGTLSLSGVEAPELSFKETTAPSGYFKVSDFTVDIRPEWNEDATQVTKVTYATSGTNLAYVSQEGRQVMVLDPAWSLANLPYMGGIGILVLLIVGGLMLVFAVRPYVLSKRAERDANLV